MAIGVCRYDEGALSVIRDATARGGSTLFRQLVGGSAISLGLRILGVLISYLAHILLSRSLGLHDYGRYVIALGWATVLAVPARAGFDYAALRYTTVYWENRDWPTLRGFMLVTALVVTGVSSLFAIAVVTRQVHLNVPCARDAVVWRLPAAHVTVASVAGSPLLQVALGLRWKT